MSCKGFGICAAWIFLLLLAACQQPGTEEVKLKYKQGFLVDTVVSPSEITMGISVRPAFPLRLDDRLVVFGSYDMVHIYSYPQLQYLHSQQLPRYVSQEVVNGELFLEYQGKVDVYRLDKADSLYQSRSFRVATVPYTTGRVQSLGEDEYIFPDNYDMNGLCEFHRVFPGTGHWSSGGQYPETPERFKRLRDFKLAYAHILAVRPDKTAFVVAYCNLRRIHIYNKKGQLLHALQLDYSPGNNHLVEPKFESRLSHCSGVIATDHYIYTVNPEQSMERAVPHGDILVLDWEGNLKARYRLDMYIDGIIVDEERKMIVGCGDKGKGRGRQFFKLKLINE